MAAAEKPATKHQILKLLKMTYEDRLSALVARYDTKVDEVQKSITQLKKSIEAAFAPTYKAWAKTCPAEWKKLDVPVVRWDYPWGPTLRAKDYPLLWKLLKKRDSLHKSCKVEQEALTSVYKELTKKLLLLGVSPEVLALIKKFVSGQ